MRIRLRGWKTHGGILQSTPPTRSETEDEGCRIVIGRDGLEGGVVSFSRAAFYEVNKERKGEGVEGIGLLTMIHE